MNKKIYGQFNIASYKIENEICFFQCSFGNRILENKFMKNYLMFMDFHFESHSLDFISTESFQHELCFIIRNNIILFKIKYYYYWTL
jgi:hypothetical protein